VDSGPDRVAIHTRQPSTGSGFLGWHLFKHTQVDQVDYLVQVPRQARLAGITSVNGSIVIHGVKGNVEASTINGETKVSGAAADLKLSTVNGRIEADLVSLGRGQSIVLDGVNGRIELALPTNANATVTASTLNGGITSEFSELGVYGEFPVGKKLNGSLGNGAGSVKAKTVNGGISIKINGGPQTSGGP
jgi:DUF4097 and DUF4098 domain-containing protein YvlB